MRTDKIKIDYIKIDDAKFLTFRHNKFIFMLLI